MIPEEILNKVSQGLASVVAKVSFKLWEEEKFRELINFDKIYSDAVKGMFFKPAASS